ncbi:MAG: hypothetical protein ACQ9IQ_13345 [Nitrospirales bacterium]
MSTLVPLHPASGQNLLARCQLLAEKDGGTRQESLDNLPPADVCLGRAERVKNKPEEIRPKTMKQSHQFNRQMAQNSCL